MKALETATIDEALITRVRDRIVERFDPQAIHLFGSAASGQTDDGSDLDLLVVMELPEGSDGRQESIALRSLFAGWKLPMDIFVLAPSEFASRQHQAGHIARIATRHGRRLYG